MKLIHIAISVTLLINLYSCAPILATKDSRELELERKYLSIVKQENEWENKYYVYSLKSVPIVGIEENRKFLAPSWKFQYKYGGIIYELDKSLGECPNLTKREMVDDLIRKYGVAAALVEIDSKDVPRLKELVWNKGEIATEYFLWRYHATLEPKIPNAVLGDWSNSILKGRTEAFMMKYKQIVDHEHASGVSSGMGEYWILNSLLTSYCRHYGTKEKMKIERRKLLNKTEAMYGRLKLDQFIDIDDDPA